MKNLILSFLTLIFSMKMVAQTVPERDQFNFGFEEVKKNDTLPYKWSIWGKGYRVLIDTIQKHSGKNSILIEPVNDPVNGNLGCIAYSIPANYEGGIIEVKAYMKLLDVSDGCIGLMLRIDGKNGMLKIDNMRKERIMGTRDWSRYSVKLPLPGDAKIIYIGALLNGKGKLWVDDFELLIDGKKIQNIKPVKKILLKADKDNEFDGDSKVSSINLSDSKIADLDILGKVWGFLKYYHPEIAKGEYNWDYELFRILPKILESNNSQERDKILVSWIKSLGKISKGKKTKTTNEKIKIKPDYSWINSLNTDIELVSILNEIKNAERTEKHYYISLNPAGNPDFRNENPYAKMKYPDPGYRLLSLYRYWNIIHYFFPYKNLIEENWNDVLKEFIPKFINASDSIQYRLAVLSLIERVHDSHANIWGQDSILNVYKGVKTIPVDLKFIENKAVIVRSYDSLWFEKSGLKIGDIIETINNVSVDNIVKERLPLTPASNLPTKLRNLAGDLLKTNEDILNIGFVRNGIKSNIQTSSIPNEKLYSLFRKKDTCFKLLSSDIAYFNPGYISRGTIHKLIPKIMKSRGLVIDFRSYPSDFIVFSMGWYLFPKQTKFVKFSEGSIITPGLFYMAKDLKVGRDTKDYYKGKIIILVDETTQSSAEYHVMAFRAAPKAKVLGSTTAGADGNVSSFFLPGGIYTMISGIGIYYPDGKETQRVGIMPDIEMRPTIKGVAEGRDELLEKAIELLKN
jgi:hypothetical protein